MPGETVVTESRVSKLIFTHEAAEALARPAFRAPSFSRGELERRRSRTVNNRGDDACLRDSLPPP